MDNEDKLLSCGKPSREKTRKCEFPADRAASPILTSTNAEIPHSSKGHNIFSLSWEALWLMVFCCLYQLSFLHLPNQMVGPQVIKLNQLKYVGLNIKII